jgi:hypothetical protein
MRREKTSAEYDKFEDTVSRLLKVPHSDIKAKLEAEKKEKAEKKEAKNKKPSFVRKHLH